MLRLWKNFRAWYYLRLGQSTAMVRWMFSKVTLRPAYGPEYGRSWIMNDDNILSDQSVPTQINPWEPWRCMVCKLFVYNVDEDGKPISGAPSPKYISRDYPIVCSVCWQLYVALDHSDYFRNMK